MPWLLFGDRVTWRAFCRTFKDVYVILGANIGYNSIWKLFAQMTIGSVNDDKERKWPMSKYPRNIVNISSLYRHYIIKYRHLTIIWHAIVRISSKYRQLTIILAQMTIECANDDRERKRRYSKQGTHFGQFFSNHFRLDAERNKWLQKRFVTNSWINNSGSCF